MNRSLIAALTVTLAACAGSRAATTPASPAPVSPAPASDRAMEAPQAGMMCPMDVPGTSVAASDTAEGEALTFTTTSGQVDELRRRVRALADMHNSHMAQGHGAPSAGTGTGEGDHHGHAHGGMPPPSRATVDDVENGARVSIAPLDPSQADRLRSAARMHAMHMQQHGCGMMHGAPAQR